MKFTTEDRKDLVWSMRKTLLDCVRSNATLTESKRISAENFIVNEATYEQLLNLVYNPERDTKYKSSAVLETVALESYKTFLTEMKKEQAAKKVVEETAKKEETKKVVKESEKTEEKKEEKAEEKKEEKAEEKKEEKAEVQENVLESVFLKESPLAGKEPVMQWTASGEKATKMGPQVKKAGVAKRIGHAAQRFVHNTGRQLSGKKGKAGIAVGAAKIAVPAAIAGGYLAKRHSSKKKSEKAE